MSGKKIEKKNHNLIKVSCPDGGDGLSSNLDRSHFLKLMMLNSVAAFSPSFLIQPVAKLMALNWENKLYFKNYKIFFDQQNQGHAASSLSVVFNDNTYMLLFQKASDAESGIQPRITHTTKPGSYWESPKLFGPDIVQDPENEFLGLSLHGPTNQGTMLSLGVHVDWSKKGVSPRWRPSILIIGRKERDDTEFIYKYYNSGTFLGEQFISEGITLNSGRILLPIWGAKQQGENWQCGILLSDDDGRSWRYRQVGFEQEKRIRNNANVPAGFNEQTLFETGNGKVISLIRGREKLGQVAESPQDTWFFRSVSEDGGENWSEPKVTNIAGTGASSNGLLLPDNSLLHACRIPYSRNLYNLAEENLFGLHIARSFDEGRTWQTVLMKQKDPEGTPFDNYYNAMNGRFIQISTTEWYYVFGQFDVERDIHRILMIAIETGKG